MIHKENSQYITESNPYVELPVKQGDIGNEIVIKINIMGLLNDDLIILRSNWIANNSQINELIIPNAIKYYVNSKSHTDFIKITKTDKYYLNTDENLIFTVTTETGSVIPCKLQIDVYYK